MANREFRVSLRVEWAHQAPAAPLDVYDDLFHLLYQHTPAVLGLERSYSVFLSVWAADAEEALHVGVMLVRASARAMDLPLGPISDMEVEPREMPGEEPPDPDGLPESQVAEPCALCDVQALGNHGDCLACRVN